ncbi:hypothetical protein CF336_g8902, partial [Tilletia laevis]
WNAVSATSSTTTINNQRPSTMSPSEKEQPAGISLDHKQLQIDHQTHFAE